MTHRYPDPFHNVAALVRDPDFSTAESLSQITGAATSGPLPNRVMVTQDTKAFSGIVAAKQSGGLGGLISSETAADNITSLDSDL